VQSVALRLVVEREIEIEAFRSQEYWSVEADVSANSPPFLARLVKHEGKKLAKFDLPNAETANAAKRAVETGQFKVAAVEKKPGRRSPPPPFMTSTLQQEAARKFGFSATRTMQTAQRLYEGVDIGGETVGLITYMRTDGLQAAPEALDEARKVIGQRFGAAYVPESARIYKTKAKNAQEAHEAIRPTSLARHPDSLRLEPDQQRLYELIWKRMMASQMESAKIERTTVEMETADGKTGLRATGQVVLFDGYLAVYEEGRDDTGEDEDGGRLPAINEGATAQVAAARADQHFTEPPPRYTEATLVKKLEELGIGRPSTYASILGVLRDRAYVRMDTNRFIPEDKGRLVTAFLEQFFAKYVEYDFTAGLEERLDLVSAGDLDWKVLLRDFWKDFHAAVQGAGELRIAQVLDALTAALAPHLFPDKGDGHDPRTCPSCSAGRLSLKTSKFGAFIGCANYPECRYTRQLSAPNGDGEAVESDRELGVDPVSGETVHLKFGRFGPYVQLGSAEKPKRTSLPKGWTPAEMDLERALKLLNLPRLVGNHPEDSKPITAGLGRYGPFILHEGTYANVESIDEVFDIGLNRAVTLLAEKRSGAGRRGRAEASVLKDLGLHPESGETVKVLSGKYGPYVKSGAVNATLPRGADPANLTMDEAVKLIAERAAKGGGKSGRKVAKKAAAKKAPAKKAPAKKAVAKKTAAKKSPAKKSAAKKKAPAKKAAKG
jgi:DNA topoisomerase-1